MTSVIQCPSCGRDTHPNYERVCSNCGRVIVRPTEPPAPSISPPPGLDPARRWEYCTVADAHSGTDAVLFSRAQRPTLVADYSKRLARGLKAEFSNPGFLHLNMGHTNVVVVAGLLGEEGCELVSHAVLTGGHQYLTFKC